MRNNNNNNIIIITGCRTVSHPTQTHDVGAFENFRAFVGGMNSCFNTSLNQPFWQTCTCGCKKITTGELASRPDNWKDPTTGVIRMFHSVGWGGWMFDVDSYSAGSFTMTGGQQTGQSGRCAINGNKMCVFAWRFAWRATINHAPLCAPAKGVRCCADALVCYKVVTLSDSNMLFELGR